MREFRTIRMLPRSIKGRSSIADVAQSFKIIPVPDRIKNIMSFFHDFVSDQALDRKAPEYLYYRIFERSVLRNVACRRLSGGTRRKLEKKRATAIKTLPMEINVNKFRQAHCRQKTSAQ